MAVPSTGLESAVYPAFIRLVLLPQDWSGVMVTGGTIAAALRALDGKPVLVIVNACEVNAGEFDPVKNLGLATWSLTFWSELVSLFSSLKITMLAEICMC